MRLVLSSIFLFYIHIAFSQNTIDSEAKNTISANGSYLFLVGSATLNYERCLYKFEDKTKLLLNTGVGKWYYLGDYSYVSSILPVSLNLLSGSLNNHFELNLGIAFLFNETTDIYAFGYDPDEQTPVPSKIKVCIPIFNIGYRYQKPQGGILFRTYLGLQGLGFGLGYAF
jgi:hypothetical protein